MNHNHRWDGIDALHKLLDWPQEALQWFKYKTATIAWEKKLLGNAAAMRVNRQAAERLRRKLSWLLELKKAAGAASRNRSDSGSLLHDAVILHRVAHERDRCNRNNATRTTAYWSIYQSCPELHWAFLAHMVSRNGGWNMTDLKGEWLPYLLSGAQQELVFEFLERANALIFRDAYPQLLLYKESMKVGRPLFHLLPQLGVSAFMRPVWECFWDYGDSVLLTLCLIVNEQNYIERRVVQQQRFREGVLDTLFFQLQSLLQLNQVVFPYRHSEDEAAPGRTLGGGSAPGYARPRLAGAILESFGSLRERIEFGKKLYAMLFGIPAIHEGAKRFAASRTHTGSRADYWPHLFAAIRHDRPVPRGKLKEKLKGGALRPGASPLYSPRLVHVWKDRPVQPPSPGDWFKDLSAMDYIRDVSAPSSFEMTHEYAFGLNKVEMAVLAGDLLK